MKWSLKIEELFQFVFGVFLFSQLPYGWGLFLLLILTPDIGMLGYLFSNKMGAVTYNLLHHKGLAIAIYLMGVLLTADILMLIGTIVFCHSALDRMFGYGLKYYQGFKFTHLGDLK